MNHQRSEFLRFCLVGLIAFLADSATLFLLTGLGLSDGVARIASLTVGMHVAYVLNSRFTYRDHRGICFATWRSFVLSNLLGAVINYTIFLTVLSLALVADQHLWRLVSIAAGTGVALMFNHWANKRFAFRRREQP